MKRRDFTAAVAALVVSRRRSQAQGTRRRLGVLEPGSTVGREFLDGLRNHGWIDGRNLTIDYRYANHVQDRLPALAAELVALNPDLLVGGGPQAAMALKSATATIPIVFVLVADPIGLGLVQSLPRPGGNMTGLATFIPGVASKRIELLKEIVPAAAKIAVLANPGNPMNRLSIAKELPQTALKLGVALPVVEATKAEELDSAFASAATQQADAIVVFNDSFHFSHAAHLTALAAKHRLPAAYLSRFYTIRGGLISYGPDFGDVMFRAGGYVDKILKGARPSDLPVEQPTKFQLVINMKTARTLGLAVPPAVIARADEVIE